MRTMQRIKRGMAAAVCAVGLGMAAAAQTEGAQSETVYIFGNSLVHHLTDSDETTVPHWIGRLAQAAGTTFQMDGQWGFLRDFADSDTPKADWRFKEVAQGWTRQYRNFADVPWSAVVITPANFIQRQPPDRAYGGDNPDNLSPLSATLSVIDTMQEQVGPVPFAIYEGWALMGNQVSRFPPGARQLRKYYRYNAGDYHNWFDDYVEMLRAARPDAEIDLIPVASVMAELFDGGVLDGIPAEALYSDDAPHGTATTYLLAAAITYVHLYQSELPLDIALPDSIHVDVRTYWEAVRDEIHRLVLKPEQQATAQPVSAAPAKTPAAEAPKLAGLGLANPALAMGLEPITDWSRQQPFINRMKTARPWIGHVGEGWGGIRFEDLIDRGLLDDDGWVWGIPDDIEAVETLILTDQSEAADGMAGRYRVTWQGTGELTLTGRARVTAQAPNEIWFDYAPGDGLVGLRINATDPERVGDYIRNIVVVALPHVPLWEAGAVFNPDWLNVIDDLRLVRFMDWMQTNGSTLSAWDARPEVSDFSYSWRGAPVEVMVQLANKIGADPWFTMPHLSDAEFQTQFATYVHDHLDPGLVAYVEYSNELWNWGFEQAQWALREGEARWGKGRDVQMQFAGMKAAQNAKLWGEVFGTQSERLIRVLATHTGWPGYEAGLLDAPLWQAEGNRAPVNYFDAYGVTGYFGVSLGMEDGAATLRGWLDAARATAQAEGAAQGLQRAALTAYVESHKFDGVFAQAVAALRAGDLRQMTEEFWPYQAQLARDQGLHLVMYEGGSHVAGVGVQANDDVLTEFYIAFSTSEELAQLYDTLLSAWQEIGGRSFNAFTDLGRPSKWGSWGHLRHLWDTTPRHDRLAEYNTKGPHWDAARDEAAFLHGGIYLGSDGPDRLEGTGKRDVLLGAGGDDVLVARGRGDLLHGGQGSDRVVLPGVRADYRFERDGARVRAVADGRIYLLTDIEGVAFDSAPALVLPIAGLL
ncbi:calcium-binding protein [Shimia sp.]|uniref:calcium-binding protein n=1 Tax=Shimia sp. TaxID=1954381 RepID=UPI003B8AC90F